MRAARFPPRFCPICCGRLSASIVQAATGPRPIGGISWSWTSTSVDAAFIGQNVYLYCASEGLGSVFRGAVDYPKLARALKLAGQQFVTFAQTVGYPRA
ncbi:MAG: nitroreductase family protein [Steroidobacteraceae bacterium]